MNTLLIKVCIRLLVTLIRRADQIMAKFEDLKASLDHITEEVAALPAMFADLRATIQDLRDQIAAGTPVTQEQLDGLEAEAQAIEDSLTEVETPPTV